MTQRRPLMVFRRIGESRGSAKHDRPDVRGPLDRVDPTLGAAVTHSDWFRGNSVSCPRELALCLRWVWLVWTAHAECQGAGPPSSLEVHGAVSERRCVRTLGMFRTETIVANKPSFVAKSSSLVRNRRRACTSLWIGRFATPATRHAHVAPQITTRGPDCKTISNMQPWPLACRSVNGFWMPPSSQHLVD